MATAALEIVTLNQIEQPCAPPVTNSWLRHCSTADENQLKFLIAVSQVCQFFSFAYYLIYFTV